MYLKVRQGSKEDHMRDMNRLILKIFEYAANSKRFHIEEFEEFVEEDEVWSAKCYLPTSSFYKKVEELFGFSDTERREIYRAIRHDMEFDRHIEDPGYVFEEDSLAEQQNEAAKELIMYLYENLFRKGRFVIRNQTTGYQEFKDSLFEHNSDSICPACLTMQTNLMKYGEVDHYFPKKYYPALILHPMNLTVICGECNGFMVKSEKNPFQTGNLTELYIPYLRAAEEEVELGVRKVEEDGEDGSRKRVKKMLMVPRIPDADGLIDKRIRNMDSLYDLSERWTYRMNTIIKYELENLENVRWEARVKKRLHDKAEERKKQAEKNKTVLLEAVALSYMDKEGQQPFLADWRMRQKEKEIMRKFWSFWS